jgi:hypothetical protein
MALICFPLLLSGEMKNGRKEGISFKRTMGMTEGSSSRFKRNRQNDDSFDDEDEDWLQSNSHKRHCFNETDEDDIAYNTHKRHCHKNIGDNGFAKYDYVGNQKDAGEGVEEVSDAILSNFNTISFDTGNKRRSMLPDREETASFPLFSSLRKSGRRIDHLVDEVIRKSSRVNPEHLDVSVSSNDFEFRMPSNVSVSGSPATDAHFLSNPGYHNLSLTTFHQVTSPYSAFERSNKSSRMGQCCPSSSNLENYPDDDHTNSSRMPPRQYHLGQVTHSEWFRDPTSSVQGSEYHDYTSHIPVQESYDDSDEDCEEMYIDS